MYTTQILSAPLQPVEVGTGSPQQSIWEWGDHRVEVGIWECGPGVLEGQAADRLPTRAKTNMRVQVLTRTRSAGSHQPCPRFSRALERKCAFLWSRE